MDNTLQIYIMNAITYILHVSSTTYIYVTLYAIFVHCSWAIILRTERRGANSNPRFLELEFE